MKKRVRTFRKVSVVFVNCVLQISLFSCSKINKVNSRNNLDTYQAEKLINKGSYFLRKRELDLARSSFSLSYEFKPSAESIDGLGCVAMLSGDYKLALSLFKKVRNQFPNYFHVLGNIALLHDSLGNKKLAKQYYEILLTHEPSNERARSNFGVMLAEDEGNSIKSGDLLREAGLISNDVVVTTNMFKLFFRDKYDE
jgi:tetratricopeptide (TPR) repeat protein